MAWEPGYFKGRENIVYPQKPNHLGVYIGKVKAISPKKKQITINLEDDISMGDVIGINENTSYISQIVNGNTVGEIKNLKNIKINDKVYKIVSHSLNKKQWEKHKKEIKKVDISCKLYENGENLCLSIKNDEIYVKSSIKYNKTAVNELDKNRIICQIQKTGNTIFRMKNVDIEVENLKLPVSQLNLLRREAIEKFEKALENNIQRKYDKEIKVKFDKVQRGKTMEPKINLYLQKFNENIDYSKFDYHEIYVPFKDLIKGTNIRDCIVILPTIIDETYEKLILDNKHIFEKVKAVAITHLSQIELLRQLKINKKMVADYTLNITNRLSQKVIKDMKIERFTISPELDKKESNKFSDDLEKELVVYGRTCLMTSKYCPIGKNRNCNLACEKGKYELKDRKDFVFPIICDKINCHTKIYNSKVLSTDYKNLAVDFVRIDLLNESESEMKEIISIVKDKQKLMGENYTNGYNLTKK